MKQSANKDLSKQLDAAVKDIPEEKCEEALSKCRDLIMQASMGSCCPLVIGSSQQRHIASAIQTAVTAHH